jgi:syntaxin 1B/2/3
MSVLVSQHQETIEVIETQAAAVEHDTEAGYVTADDSNRILTDDCSLKHTDDAVKSARAARKKRLICFFIIILIVVIIAATIGGYYASQNKKTSA